MKKIALLIGLLITTSMVFSQKYITKNGHIKFYSETPIETIEAHNRQVNCALDIEKGDFVFKVLMKSFEFEKALMQEHFNENYVESDKYPNATFIGKAMNIGDFEIETDAVFDAQVEGELTIHGVTKTVTQKGTFKVTKGKIEGNSTFIIRPEDFDIKIPSTVINNIAEEIKITVSVALSKID